MRDFWPVTTFSMSEERYQMVDGTVTADLVTNEGPRILDGSVSVFLGIAIQSAVPTVWTNSPKCCQGSQPSCPHRSEYGAKLSRRAVVRQRCICSCAIVSLRYN